MKLIVNKYQGTKSQNESLWYGGKVAEIIVDNQTYTIESIGDIRCELIAKHDIIIDNHLYKKDDVVLNIIDKNNSGGFKREIEKFIRDDEELNDLILNDNPDYELVFGNNNWLEVFYDNGESDVLDCSTIDEAIENILDEIKKKLRLENENIIYCRSANQSEFAIKNQEEICKNYILNSNSNHSYDLFVDNGFNGLEPFENPAFSNMIKLLDNNKKFYSINISRLSRNINETAKIYDIITNKNSDFYFIHDQKSLSEIKKLATDFAHSCIEAEKEVDEIEYE